MASNLHYLKKFLLSGSVYAATAVTSAGSAQVDQGDKGDQGDQGDQSDLGDQGDSSIPSDSIAEGAQDTEGGKSEEEIQKGSSGGCDPCTGKLLRRTDLPLYDDSHPQDTKKCDDKPSGLEKNIGAVRKELWVWHDKYTGYREKIVEVVETGKAHTSALIGQLRREELPIPRAGAIAISGLTGVILGLRGGWVKRIVYGSTCAGLMAAICYPQETAEISQEALATTKKYVQITYNFIYGGEIPETPLNIEPPVSIEEPSCDDFTSSDLPELPVLPEQPSNKSQSPSSKDTKCICTNGNQPDKETKAK